ncbi:MAG: NADPH-dependent 7-cyano-7-deazaguanine reductase QueF, partial [Rhodoferax sp.]|nr:NADPH-dependent 7-cyano-7-deazaguanine reductase QueF [Rhodoferax sp.]
MNTPEQSQLGKSSAYVDRYDASLLFPIPRSGKRAEIGIHGAAPFLGADMWTAFELSWLNPRGKPQVALAHFTVPCESLNIIESKSFKLYLNSFNNTCFADFDAVRSRLRADITEAVWRGAGV